VSPKDDNAAIGGVESERAEVGVCGVEGDEHLVEHIEGVEACGVEDDKPLAAGFDHVELVQNRERAGVEACV
jgi:hypothetical protein